MYWQYCERQSLWRDRLKTALACQIREKCYLVWSDFCIYLRYRQWKNIPNLLPDLSTAFLAFFLAGSFPPIFAVFVGSLTTISKYKNKSENLDTGKGDKYNAEVDIHSAFDLTLQQATTFFLLKSTHFHMTKYPMCRFYNERKLDQLTLCLWNSTVWILLILIFMFLRATTPYRLVFYVDRKYKNKKIEILKSTSQR